MWFRFHNTHFRCPTPPHEHLIDVHIFHPFLTFQSTLWTAWMKSYYSQSSSEVEPKSMTRKNIQLKGLEKLISKGVPSCSECLATIYPALPLSTYSLSPLAVYYESNLARGLVSETHKPPLGMQCTSLNIEYASRLQRDGGAFLSLNTPEL